MPDELGKDGVSVSSLQRKHANFENDLQTLGTAVSYYFMYVKKLSITALLSNKSISNV